MSNCCPPPKPSEKTTNGDHCAPKNRIDYLLYGSLVIIVLAYVSAVSGLAVSWGPNVPGGVITFCHSVHEFMDKMWWGVLIGIVFVGILEHVPRELVLSALGNSSGFKGILRATLAGLFFDLCSHGILMVGMKLYERGANLGQVMAFLIASPWNSLSLTVILFSLIGWQWTLVFILGSLVIAAVSGLLFNHLVGCGRLPSNPNATVLPNDYRFWPGLKGEFRKIQWTPKSFYQLFKGGLLESLTIIRWLFIGVILASALQSLTSLEDMQNYFGPTMLGLTLTLIATTIIEVCSEGSTPIAADLLNRAGAPGNAFTFLMAGVSTDYTEVMVIKDSMRSWKIALFLPLITVPQVIALGFLFNYFR